jgi:transposase
MYRLREAGPIPEPLCGSVEDELVTLGELVTLEYDVLPGFKVTAQGHPVKGPPRLSAS